MAKNELLRLIENLDRIGSSLVISGPSRVAKRTISELQQAGPSWTGKFSNSWAIETPDGRDYKGDGAAGEPRPIKLPAGLLTGRQNLRGSLPIKNRAVTTIYNFSDWVEQATDRKKDFFSRPTETPQTALGLRKWEIHQGDSGRPMPGKRGDVPGPLGRMDTGKDSRTAELDWFENYNNGGHLDRAVTIEIDKIMREFK
tara:strand:- start:163 stop:759 length:597 start_codon:yes stop_codon:yes gene_type:complete